MFGIIREDLSSGQLAFALTAERPWRENKTNISCIPPGTYIAYLRKRSTGQKVYELKAVPGRSNILIHIGNKPLKDSQGCILIGEKFDLGPSGDTVLGMSGEGFKEFMVRAGNDKEIQISILDPLNLTR